MKPMNGFVAIALALCVASGALACGEKGPLEKTGETVDRAVDDVGDKIEDVKDDITD